MKPNTRFALEILATSDALRRVRWKLAELIHDEKAGIGDCVAIVPVLQHGLPVADALEVLAERLALG